MLFEQIIQDDIQGKYLAVIYVISDLPADRSVWVQQPDGFGNRSRLLLDVRLNRGFSLVLFANILRRRSDDEIHALLL